MTSLADMTPEQREQYVGMWADVPGKTWIIASVRDETCTLVDPLNGYSSLMNRHVTPRWDLPRAWQPDGQPVVMDVEGADYRPGTNRGFYILDETIQKGRELPEGTTRTRRFVGEWEGEWEEE